MTCPWDSLEQAALLSCEEPVCGWIGQPSNTYSNLGYFIVAGLLAWRARSRERRDHDVPFALLAFAIGICSTLAHASLTHVFAVLDFVSIFALFSYIFASNLALLNAWSARRRQVVTSVLVAIVIVPLVYVDRSGLALFALYATGCLVSEAMAIKRLALWRRDRRYFYSGLGFLSLGLVCFILDERKIVCNPSDHVFQLHTVWHLLAATSIYFVALYFERDHKSA